MSRVSLCWPNRISESTVTAVTVSAGEPTSTAADFVATLPLANVKDRIIKKVARTGTNALASVCIKVLLPKERLIGVVALVNHNLSTAATMRIKAYKGTTNATTLLFDSGVGTKVWPAITPQKSMSWGDSNFWLGTIEEEQRASYTSLATYFSAVCKGGRFVEIIISDTNNANGYLQFGRVFVGQWIEPDINPEYGDLAQSYLDTTEIQDIPGSGTEYFYQHAKKRTVQVTWKHLGISDAMSGIYDAYRSQGINGELLYVYSKNVIDRNFYARTFLSRFTSLDPIGQPYCDAYSATINLQEIL